MGLLAVVAVAGAGFAAPLSAAADAWSVVPTPNVGTGDNQLQAITCAGTGGCTAVGAYVDDSGVFRTLIERNSGSGWVIVASPSVGAGNNLLQGVTCAGTTCWAVGYYEDSTGLQHGLIERDTGSGWAIVSSPTSSTRPDILYGVTCAGSSRCIAVGYHPFHGAGVPPYQTLIEENNGRGWVIVSSPNPADSFNILRGVSCVSAGDCTAVGSTSNLQGKALIERNTGSGWVIVATPDAPGTDDELNTVNCQPDGACWAAGDYDANHTGAFRTLIEQNTGSGWTVVPSPNFGNGVSNVLQGLVCTGPNECWAVGWYNNGAYHGLIEQKTATGWALVPSPVAGIRGDLLNGIDCMSPGNCFAAGYSLAAKRNETLVEHLVAGTGADVAMNLRAASTSTIGRELTYRLHISDLGPADASSLRVHFSLPVGTTFVSASGGGRLDANHDSVRWTLPALASGGKITLTVTLRMDAVKSMRAFASVYAGSLDPVLTNNSSSVLTRVAAG